MIKWIAACVAVVAVSAFLVWDYMSFNSHKSYDLASLEGKQAMMTHAEAKTFARENGSYFNHFLSRLGLGKSVPLTKEMVQAEQDALRAAQLNSYLPTPDADEGILEGWERLEWDDSYQAAFGWPDGLKADADKKKRAAHAKASAIYLKGSHAIYAEVSLAEPTEMLARRLKQSYWVLETGRDIGRLKEGRPRASYFWTNIRESAPGYSVKYAKEVSFFESYDGVHFLKAKNKKDRRDVETKYYFAGLGGGVVIKVRALASKSKVKEILAGIDYASLNQMQTLPNPLIAEGLKDVLLETPDSWLTSHGYPAKVAMDHAKDDGHTVPKPAKH